MTTAASSKPFTRTLVLGRASCGEDATTGWFSDSIVREDLSMGFLTRMVLIDRFAWENANRNDNAGRCFPTRWVAVSLSFPNQPYSPFLDRQGHSCWLSRWNEGASMGCFHPSP